MTKREMAKIIFINKKITHEQMQEAYAHEM